MKKVTCFRLIAFLLTCLFFCGCQSGSIDEETTNFTQGGQTDEEMIIARMNNLKEAFMAKDADAIVANFSEEYISEEGDNKEEFRTGLKMVIGLGMLPEVVMNLDNPHIEITGDTAEFFTVDASGRKEVAYILKKEGKDIWLIIGDKECSYDSYTSSYGDDCVEHAGYYRCWDIHVPEGIKGSVPLVIDLHGHSESPSSQKEFSGFGSLADSEGFIVVWPYGLCESWNSGAACCPLANEDNIDDVGFLRKMVEKVSAQYDIDTNRIYVTGLSNGASMAQRLANEASDMIAAAASVSLHLLVPEAADYTPVSVIMLYGNQDLDIYDPEEFITAKENFNKWKTMNDCKGSYVETWKDGDSVAWTYQDCEDSTEVTIVTLDGGGHVLYQGQQTEIDTTRMAWDFMKRFTK
ncbi:MAG: PHB depolymerase family esterase [Planctomycetota bacterium]|jgi:polyhydroxybutyrate depolymerase